jgi:hypothetical protein
MDLPAVLSIELFIGYQGYNIIPKIKSFNIVYIKCLSMIKWSVGIVSMGFRIMTMLITANWQSPETEQGEHGQDTH